MEVARKVVRDLSTASVRFALSNREGRLMSGFVSTSALHVDDDSFPSVELGNAAEKYRNVEPFRNSDRLEE